MLLLNRCIIVDIGLGISVLLVDLPADVHVAAVMRLVRIMLLWDVMIMIMIVFLVRRVLGRDFFTRIIVILLLVIVRRASREASLDLITRTRIRSILSLIRVKLDAIGIHHYVGTILILDDHTTLTHFDCLRTILNNHGTIRAKKAKFMIKRNNLFLLNENNV